MIKVGEDLHNIVESHNVCLARNKAKNLTAAGVTPVAADTLTSAATIITEIIVTPNSAEN